MGIHMAGDALAAVNARNAGQSQCYDIWEVGAKIVGGAIASYTVFRLAKPFGRFLGPEGPVFGRRRLRQHIDDKAGILNRWEKIRLGWSWNNKGWAGPRNYWGLHGGKYNTPGHWHAQPIPGPKGK